MTFPAGSLVRDLKMSELGYGRVLQHRDDGFALIRFGDEAPREMRLKGQTDLVRARLHPGQRVEVLSGGGPGNPGKIAKALDQGAGALWSYGVVLEDGGEERALGEDSLIPLGARSADPLELLESLDYRGPRSFFARNQLLRTVSIWYENSFGIPPFLGSRIHALPHQIHAARRVLCDRLPRFVLADEVGLGKTIEAGMVIQALQAADANLRVLVLAPGAMSRQWLCELFLRFGEQIFVHVDAARLRDGEDPGELFAAQRLIVSTTALEAHPEVRELLLEEEWDLLVIDEAHQIPPTRPLYAFLRRLAKASWGLLALSATPSKRDIEGLLGLLALVAPDVYDPERPDVLTQRLAQQDEITSCLTETLAALEGEGALPAALVSRWEEVLPGDEVVKATLGRIAGGEADACDELVAYTQEYHRIDRRIVRTRRSTVRSLGTDLCERQVEVVAYDVPASERELALHLEGLPKDGLDSLQLGLRGLYLRAGSTSSMGLLTLLEARQKVLLESPPSAEDAFDLLAALSSDPGPAEEEHLRGRVLREAPPLPGELDWLRIAIEMTHVWMIDSPGGGCARYAAAASWIQERIKGGRKVLVFAQDREAVLEFAELMRDRMGPDAVGAIHHELDEMQLSEIALLFQQPEGVKVLVSDELGGEGRNFQIATALVHLDQPWPVARLEQRIGRLDRVGREASRPVLSVVFKGASPSERALLRLHCEVFDVYQRSIGGLEFLLPRLQREISEAACLGAEALDALVAPFSERVAAERSRVDEAYERALDSSARRLEEASEYAEILEETDGAQDVSSLAGWARQLGIKFKPQGDDVWSLRWTWEHLRRPPPGLYPPELIPLEGRVRKRGTFSRLKALQDESLEFFGPGHPLIDSIVRDLHEQAAGRATVCLRDLGPEHRGRCYLLVVARTELDASVWEGVDVSAGLIYRAQTRIWPQARVACALLQPGKTPAAVLVKDRALLSRIEGSSKGPSARKVDRDDLGRSVHLPLLWAALRKGVDLALSSIRDGRRAEVDEAVETLGEDLRDDIGFFRGVAARHDGDAREQAEREIEARDKLLAGVRGERVLLDAVAIVVGG